MGTKPREIEKESQTHGKNQKEQVVKTPARERQPR